MSVTSCISRVFCLNISQSVVPKQSCNTCVVFSVHKLTAFVVGLDVFNLDLYLGVKSTVLWSGRPGGGGGVLLYALAMFP